jgi:hypothetical protein
LEVCIDVSVIARVTEVVDVFLNEDRS